MTNREKGNAVKTGFVVAMVAIVTLLALPSAPSAQEAPPAGEERRHAIRMMEAVLSRAVLTGAEHLAERLGSGNPGIAFFTGQAKARGFVLEGYGLFFHVEIPEMQQSVVWSVTTTERDAALASVIDQLRRAVDSVPEGTSKLQAELAIKRLQLQVGPLPPVAGSGAAGGGQRMLRAAGASAVTEPVDPGPMLKDPSVAYREAIRASLIDAMLEHSRGLNIRPDEWLSIAAHRGQSPLAPNEIVTTTTLVLRVKGSDLAQYDADRSRKEEIRQRVEAREF
jgi:hypothetical protein